MVASKATGIALAGNGAAGNGGQWQSETAVGGRQGHVPIASFQKVLAGSPGKGLSCTVSAQLPGGHSHPRQQSVLCTHTHTHTTYKIMCFQNSMCFPAWREMRSPALLYMWHFIHQFFQTEGLSYKQNECVCVSFYCFWMPCKRNTAEHTLFIKVLMGRKVYLWHPLNILHFCYFLGSQWQQTSFDRDQNMLTVFPSPN